VLDSLERYDEIIRVVQERVPGSTAADRSSGDQ
jgi:hypothetical protein